MELRPRTLTGPLGRLGAAGQNALEVARFGGLPPDKQPSPYVVVAEHPVYKLRRYHDGTHRDGPATARTAEKLSDGLAGSEEGHRPGVVHVVDEIPVTTWHRPLTTPLRGAGCPILPRGRRGIRTAAAGATGRSRVRRAGG